ncbi:MULTISPECIES: SDR family oxidoreductase [Sphingobium]|uniref:SDR family oxidoreductase n=1 Tax=Sphingobium TaxID=165695 RepID=UPI0011A26E25|nr:MULTISPECIES: SDR family oxidoreductase [Sphingobium]
MSQKANANGKPLAVVIGATSKWQSDGPDTKRAHGADGVDDSDMPVGIRWGVGGAVAQKFAREGFFVVMTTRTAANAEGLKQAIEDHGGEGMIVELDLGSHASIVSAFQTIRETAGDPDFVLYNPGYSEGRSLPKEQELLEYFPLDMFDTALQLAARAPFLVAKEVLPAMRERGSGSLFFSNNKECLRGRKRNTGSSLYYPRVMMRSLAQALTDEYSEYGVHAANIVIDGGIDAPGVRALAQKAASGGQTAQPANLSGPLLDPTKIAEAIYYLHIQDPSCWSHEIQLTPFKKKLDY